VRALADILFKQNGVEGKTAGERLWGKREQYLKDLVKHNVYVAPRRFEGIGMSFLEAMAMGMCVVAENQPTANEYIVSGQNGILFEAQNGLLFPARKTALPKMIRMGKAARNSIASIYQEWNINLKEVSKLVKGLQTKPLLNKKKLNLWLAATLNFENEPQKLSFLIESFQQTELILCSSQKTKNQKFSSPKKNTSLLYRFIKYPRKTVTRFFK